MSGQRVHSARPPGDCNPIGHGKQVPVSVLGYVPGPQKKGSGGDVGCGVGAGVGAGVCRIRLQPV